jgi:integrator complex subunit 9
MRLQSLGEQIPCYLLTFKNTNILIDCAIELQSLLHVHPLSTSTTRLNVNDKSNDSSNNRPFVAKNGMLQVEEIRLQIPRGIAPSNKNQQESNDGEHNQRVLIDLSQIDVILISNLLTILALPYLFQDPINVSLFQGKIYATEPTVQIGKKFMEELVVYIQKAHHKEIQTLDRKKQQHTFQPSKKDLFNEEYTDFVKDLFSQYSKEWKSIYSMKDVETCMKFIRPISFQERISVFGALEVTPVSSGFCLGSANWIIQTEYEKIVYMSSSSGAAARHPEPLAVNDLKNANMVIVTDISSVHDKSPDASLHELCRNIGVTVSGGGDVLIPVYSSGIIYDLIEFIRSYLNSLNLHSTNMYFVSPTAKHSLAYSNISAEWLCGSKQDKAFVAEPPFAHHSLLVTRQLQVFENVGSEFAQVYHQNRANPCVIFAGHPSCRFGDILHLIKLFEKNSKNAMICIEPDYSFNNLIAPFQFSTPNFPIVDRMSVINCPVDFRLKRTEIQQLLKSIEPENVILPLHIAKQLDIKFIQQNLAGSGKLFTLDPLGVLNVRNMKRKFEQAKISNDLANEIYPKQMKGMNVSRVSARLHAKDGNYTLLPIQQDTKLQNQQMLFGDVTVERIVHSLQSEGLDVDVVMKSYGLYQIDVPSLQSHVIFCTEETQINAPSKHIREYLRKVVCSNFYIL